MNHSAILSVNGESIFTFGLNVFGELGVPRTNYEDLTLSPIQVSLPNKKKIIKVVTYDRITIVLDIDGAVWACGFDLGSLGVSSKNKSVSDFIPVTGHFSGKRIVDFCTSGWFTILIDEDGKLWRCGIDVGVTRFGDDNFTITEKRSKKFIPFSLPIKLKILNVSCNVEHGILIDENLEAWSFGKDSCGRLGLGDLEYNYVDTPRKINGMSGSQCISSSCGPNHSIILCSDGTLFGFGSNDSGQLGFSSKLKSLMDTFGIKHNTSYNKPFRLTNFPKIQKISCCNSYTMALDFVGDIWVCGNNQCGQLGLGDNIGKIFTPIKVPLHSKIIDINTCGDHSIIIDENNNSLSAGLNPDGYGDQYTFKIIQSLKYNSSFSSSTNTSNTKSANSL